MVNNRRIYKLYKYEYLFNSSRNISTRGFNRNIIILVKVNTSMSNFFIFRCTKQFLFNMRVTRANMMDTFFPVASTMISSTSSTTWRSTTSSTVATIRTAFIKLRTVVTSITRVIRRATTPTATSSTTSTPKV